MTDDSPETTDRDTVADAAPPETPEPIEAATPQAAASMVADREEVRQSLLRVKELAGRLTVDRPRVASTIFNLIERISVQIDRTE